MQPRVYVNIVTWNGMKYLPEAIASLVRQTLPDFKVTIIDNGSIDGTIDYIRTNFPHFQFLRNTKNLGFAKTHNQGIEMVRNAFYGQMRRGEIPQDAECFILLMNQDIILDLNCLENLVKTLVEKEEVGVIGPKLLRAYWDLDTIGKTSEVILSSIIDSAGLVMKKTRQCADKGAGELDGEKFDKPGYVFGVSGALPMFRLKALEDARIRCWPSTSSGTNLSTGSGYILFPERSEAESKGGEYFDEDFFSYKEDVDLCWRLFNLGWKAYYEPNAFAYHFRGAKGMGVLSFFKMLKERRKRSNLVNFWSTRNHLLTLVKNDSLKNFLRDAWAILPYEFVKFLFILFFETENLCAYGDFIKLLSKAIRKRKYGIIYHHRLL